MTEEAVGDGAPELLWHLLGVELRLVLGLVKVGSVVRVRVRVSSQG